MALDFTQGWTLAESEKGRHQRIALLAPFGLGNDMGVPLAIMPYKLGLLAVEHTDEGYASVGSGELEEFS
ncbi:MAG: hypothetical protein OIF34_01750, partial [Porticoccaceae bacterium]|nr:hypothetical protein [Porticoccaceae bacterium]